MNAEAVWWQHVRPAPDVIMYFVDMQNVGTAPGAKHGWVRVSEVRLGAARVVARPVGMRFEIMANREPSDRFV